MYMIKNSNFFKGNLSQSLVFLFQKQPQLPPSKNTRALLSSFFKKEDFDLGKCSIYASLSLRLSHVSRMLHCTGI